MPGPSSSTVSTPAATRTVTRAVGRAPLGGVVEQVGDRALEGRGLADHPPRGDGHVEVEPRCPAADPDQGPVDHLGQVDRLDHVGQRLVAGQLDQVADEGGQLLDLGADVVEQLGARLGRQAGHAARVLVGLGEQVEVGAQGRERGAELVAGVGHQPPLPVPGRRDGGEQLVEGRGEPGDLVVALDRERGEVLGAGDLLDGRGEAAYGPQAVAGHRPAGECRGDHPGDAEEQHHEAQLGQRPLLRLEGLRDHQRLAGRAGRDGDDAVAGRRPPRSCGCWTRSRRRRPPARARPARSSGPGRRSATGGRR